MTIEQLINEQTKAINDHIKCASGFEEEMKIARNEGHYKELQREALFHLEEAAWIRQQQLRNEKLLSELLHF